MDYDEMLSSIVRWAFGRADVLAVVLTGSRARVGAVVDEFSDLDVELIVEDWRVLARDASWWGSWGSVVTVLAVDPSRGQRWATRSVLYEGGLQLDVTVAERARLKEMVRAQSLDPVYERGYAVVLDKVGVSHGLPAASGGFPMVAVPSQGEFRAVVEEFWFEAAQVPRYLARGDLWVVKQRDWVMKQLLLRALEWYAASGAGGGPGAVDVRHEGSRLGEWLDDGTVAELGAVFGRFDARDAWRAWEATIALFARVSPQTAQACGLEYPWSTHDRVLAYLEKVAAEVDLG